ncbi:MAG: glycosyltransferase family 2 protein [Bacteroidetes bacterium]|nr:glycosyltransferase family 2 protein [Bacteroidota bacterium]MBS1639262.1 glycosyltransferase family 2 protein [Bacteroidota bacterium]MBS1642997.1 glycosyltransferase family 2 protein [Bacteroidota bacterium]MBS1671068.1 glycosyltransferase family 2 protein [Bacteroidota bacterium]
MQLSILIRNLNQANELEICLKSLKHQVTDFNYEIVVVDNESNDNSVAIAKQYGCKVINLPRKEFTYGKALNIGIANCLGEFVLNLSSHVTLLSQNFLQQIPKLFSNEKIVGLKFANVANSNITHKAFVKGETLVNWQTERGSINNIWLHGIVNNCSAIRKTMWQEISFNEKLFYSEDKVWSYQVLKTGYSLKINIPLFYQYNKAMTRQQLISKRAMEEAAHILFTKNNGRSYSTNLKLKIKYTLKQIRSSYLRISAYWQVQKIVKSVLKKEFNNFSIDEHK